MLLGDLALLHDLSGLLAARRLGIPLLVVVVNNDGGGIFQFLPVAEATEHFEELFATPHGLDFSHVAGLCGATFQRPRTASDLRACIRKDLGNGLSIVDIGWCKDPYTTPSTIRYAAKGMLQFQGPVWAESWFPNAFIGTMAQLLISLESGCEPAIKGRDNLKTMALVEAAYLSAAQYRPVRLGEIERSGGLAVTSMRN